MPELITATEATAPVVSDVTAELQELTKKAGLVAERLRAEPTTVDTKAIETELDTLKGQMEPLLAEQEKQAKSAQIADLLARLEVIENLPAQRKHEWDVSGVQTPGGARGAVDRFAGKSFAYVLSQGKRGNPAYRDLLWDWHAENARGWDAKYGTKALAEGGSTTGGFLVPPTYMQDLVLLRRATAPLLQYVRSLPVNSNQVLIPTQTGVSTVGWTAENAVKPSTDELFGQITVNVFTLAGIAKISNQLLEDSTPAVDAVVREDLLRGLNIEMDRTVLNGSGTGQSTGILNTAGVVSTVASAQTAASIIDDILSAIGRLQAAYFGNPDAIVMAPRTFTKLQGAKDSAGRYLAMGTILGSQQLSLPGLPNPTGSTDSGMSLSGGQVLTFMGYPVVVDANFPITGIGGVGNSGIVVGALREAWALMRDEIRMDTSNEAGTSFETNQTWFRGEMRMGFTAARLPSAFQIVNGVGA